MTNPATLVLADGTIFKGIAIGKEGQAIGHIALNTAMIGYQETLTDPATVGQLIAFTYPHIGNSGVNEADNESDRIQAAGLIIRDLPLLASNFRSEAGLEDYLRRYGTVGISGIDTRHLTRHIRATGSQLGAIVTEDNPDIPAIIIALNEASQSENLSEEREERVDLESVQAPYEWTQGQWQLGQGSIEEMTSLADAPHIAVIDLGVKRQQLRVLKGKGCKVTVMPASVTLSEILAIQPKGVFLSSGPGNPAFYPEITALIRALLVHKIPLFAIGLGHQLLGLALGAKLYSYETIQWGINHPVKALASDQIMMTHYHQRYAISEEGLPALLKVTHRSLIDDSIQGMRLERAPGESVYSFQAYPEGDAACLFDEFINAVLTK